MTTKKIIWSPWQWLFALLLLVLSIGSVVQSALAQTSGLELIRLRTRGLGPTSREDITTNLTFIELAVRNTTGRSIQFRVAVEFSTSGNILLQTLNDRTPIHVIQPGETLVLTTPQIFRLGAFAGPTIQQPPILPVEGAYDVCLRVFNAEDERDVYVSRGCLTSQGSGPVTTEAIQSRIKRVMGIPATIGGVLKTDGGYLLSGRITLPASNDQSTFRYSAGREVNFFDVFFPQTTFQGKDANGRDIIPEDVSPEGDVLPLVDTDIEVRFRGWLPMTIRNERGLEIRRDPNYRVNGVNLPTIRDRMFIDMNRFLQDVPSSGTNEIVQVLLSNGASGTLVNNDTRVPAVLFGSPNPHTVSGTLRASNPQDISWRLFGFDLGFLDRVELSVSDTNLVVTGDMKLTMPNTTVSSARIRLAFSSRGTGAERVSTNVSIPRFTLGGPGIPVERYTTSLALPTGFFTQAGLRMTGVVTCANAKIRPTVFDVGMIDFSRRGAEWRIAASRLIMRENNNTQLTIRTIGQTQDLGAFSFEDAQGRYHIIGLAESSFRSAVNPGDYTARTVVTYRPDGSMRIASPATAVQEYTVPTNTSLKGSVSGAASDLLRASISSVFLRIDSIFVKDENDPDKLSVNGTIELSLPSGIKVTADEIIVSRRQGLVSVNATLEVELQSLQGKINFGFNRDSSVWKGNGEVMFNKAVGAVGFETSFTYQNSENWDFVFIAKKSPGYALMVSPPLFLNGLGGGLAREGSRWTASVIGLFSVFSAQESGAAGLDIRARATVKFGNGPVILEVAADEVIARLAQSPGGDEKENDKQIALGSAALQINFSDFRITGQIKSEIEKASLVKFTMEGNLDVYPSRNQYFFDFESEVLVLNALKMSNSRVILGYKYGFTYSDAVTGMTTAYNAFTGLFASMSRIIIDQTFDKSLDLGPASVSIEGDFFAGLSGYATIQVSEPKEIFGITIPGGIPEPGGGGFVKVRAAGGGRVIGVRLRASLDAELEGKFSGTLVTGMNFSARGKLELKASASIGKCSAGCNSAKICLTGAAAKVCLGIRGSLSIESATQKIDADIGF